MTFRAPQAAPRPFAAALPQPADRVALSNPTLFGHYVLEVLTPDGRATTPELPGWQTRSWPVARLGDVTLEARALSAQADAQALTHALNAAGYRVLGPVRPRRG